MEITTAVNSIVWATAVFALMVSLFGLFLASFHALVGVIKWSPKP